MELEKNYATIQKIISVKPLENSDNLDLVRVLGWNVVTKRNEYKEGDLCVFITIDTVLPPLPEFSFLKDRNYRVKTIKLRGQISQGIIFPLSILKDKEVNFNEGIDVTDILNITHYEKPVPLNRTGLTRGNFPTHLISKTDEKKLQDIPKIIDELDGIIVYSTVKCDGTSASFINHNDDIYVCSRNNSLKLEDKNNLYMNIYEKYDIISILENKNIAIQGEICGPGIQKNRMELKDFRLYVFNMWDIEKMEYFSLDQLLHYCNKYNLELVPIDDIFIFNKNIHTIDFLLEKSKGLYPNTKTQREGIVIRPVKEMKSLYLKGGRVSFKVLNNEYLLKYSE